MIPAISRWIARLFIDVVGVEIMCEQVLRRMQADKLAVQYYVMPEDDDDDDGDDDPSPSLPGPVRDFLSGKG